MNRNIPLIVAVGVGVMSGFYIWEPLLQKYQRDSKGTWKYDVVQQSRNEEMSSHADAISGSNNTTNPPETPVESATLDATKNKKSDS